MPISRFVCVFLSSANQLVHIQYSGHTKTTLNKHKVPSLQCIDNIIHKVTMTLLVFTLWFYILHILQSTYKSISSSEPNMFFFL